MEARDWDERYSGAELVWSATPNVFVERIVEDWEPGTALDIAAGEGRNAIWLASLGWDVTAVDFSAVGLQRALGLAAGHPDAAVAGRVTTLVADVTAPYPAGSADLVLLCYLQLPPAAFLAALEEAASHVGAGGVLLVIGHDKRNLAEGHGGPQSLEVLQDPALVAATLTGLGFRVERAQTLPREVPGALRPALDCVVLARR